MITKDKYLDLRYRAQKKAQRAVKKGFIPKLDGSIKCVDCKNSKATCYDHRDYRKPLDVDPVCKPCNNKRGMALPGYKDWKGQSWKHTDGISHEEDAYQEYPLSIDFDFDSLERPYHEDPTVAIGMREFVRAIQGKKSAPSVAIRLVGGMQVAYKTRNKREILNVKHLYPQVAA